MRDGLALDRPTLCAAFQATAARHSDGVALREFGGSGEIGWREYAARVRAVAGGLAAAGVARGDTVAMMLRNRPESVIVDTAAMHLGAIPFSIYNTSSPEQVEYLFGHARCRVVVTEELFAPTVMAVAAGIEGLERVYVIDAAVDGAATAAELERAAPDGFDFEASWRAVRNEDVATLIYTSGTTGPPKAVELTHANLLCQMRMLDQLFPTRPAGRAVSYLPMAHLADRWAAHYTALVAGTSVTFVADMAQVFAAVVETRPTAWGAVPRVWEKLKAALEAGFAAAPAERRQAIEGGLAAASAVVRAEQAGETPAPDLVGARERADAEIFAALRAQLGLEQVEYLVSGAAPIAVEVLEFFAALGLPIHEVWGMTETSLIATVNPPDGIRIGTVGRALPGVELSLADDGELLVRGPTIMRGYRDDRARTAEAIDARGMDAHGRRRDDRRRRLRADRRSQEGADHQRRRQEHVAVEHREPAEGGLSADRKRRRDRRSPGIQHGVDRARPARRRELRRGARPGGGHSGRARGRPGRCG